MVATIIGIAVLVAGLALSIGLHELGHLLPAKRFGVRVPQYFIGFGPTLWSRKRGETEYGVKAIPLGGYVRLVGMFPSAAEVGAVRKPGRIGELIWQTREESQHEVPPGEEKRAFHRLTTGKKVTVMMGGPIMNLVIAVVLMVVVYCGIGFAGPSTTIGAVSSCIPSPTSPDQCQNAAGTAPAVAAGLQAGDRIVAINGNQVNTWDDIRNLISASQGRELEIRYLRGDTTTITKVTPLMMQALVTDDKGTPQKGADGKPLLQKAPVLGISSQAMMHRQSIGQAMAATWQGTVATFKVIVNLPVVLFDLVKSMVNNTPRDPGGVIGLVGIGRLASEIVGTPGLDILSKVSTMLALLASLNIALFAFNMLPLLPLDGGHIAGALWGGLKRRIRGKAARPVDTARLMPLTYGVFTVLIAMTVLLVVADIVKPVSFG